jgi:glycosyltransferase involved in cell wall biosynthesis
MLPAMRVLAVGSMYPPHFEGGYELVWRSAVRHLRDRGHSVRVLVSDYRVERPDPEIPEDPDAHRDLRWYWRDHSLVRLGPRTSLELERHNTRVLRSHLRELEPDVVAWWAMGAMSLSMIEVVRRCGVPAVGFVHDRWMLYGPDVDSWQRGMRRLGPLAGPLGSILRVPTRLDLGRAGRWLFSSEALRDEILSVLHLPDTGVVRPGIEPGLFPAAPETDWRGRLLYLGRIDPPKGIATAIRAVASLPGTSLEIVGTGAAWHEAKLRDLARTLAVADRISFRGHVPRAQLADTYGAADALVFPVLWEEPWGLVPLEAMAVGRPVVATGSGGSAEYMRHERNCLIFEPRDDPAALADAVGRLEEDAGLRRRLRESGFETARQHTEDAFNEAVARELEQAAVG